MTFYHPLSPADKHRLDALALELQAHADTMVGYPCNAEFDYQELYRFLGFSINNLGDPFASSNYRVNTQAFERDVLTEFAAYVHCPADDFWGYVTNGGTEGNMYGLYLGRELFPGGMVYFSEDTHYSVVKILHVLGVRSIMIRSQANGEMDYEDLEATLRLHRDVPPIIFANIGTTMKGAVDNIPHIKSLFKKLAITQYYLHADCALSGMILPFVDKPQPFDFRTGIDSMSVSGHKLIGCPMPCGFALARKRHVYRIARTVEYVGALDSTINGSRNGITPLFLWYALKRLGHDGLKELVAECLRLADYAIAAFAKAGIEAWRNENSITVVFPRPSDAVMKKWQIAPYQDIAHIITVPQVREEVIDAIVRDMVEHPAVKAA
jgi:histidine decarboxylase